MRPFDVGPKLAMAFAVLVLSACESGEFPTEPSESAVSSLSASSQQVVALTQSLPSLSPGDPIPGHYLVRFDHEVTDARGLAAAITVAYGSTAK